MVKCPTCDKGTLKSSKNKHVLFGIDLGTYAGQKCTFCGEIWTDAEVMDKIEKIAKKKGIWGLGKKTKITKSGNSMAIRIPKIVADYLKLKEGKEAWLHPEKDKLVIEPIG